MIYNWLPEPNHEYESRAEKIAKIGSEMAKGKDAIIKEMLEEYFGAGYNQEEVFTKVFVQSFPDRSVYWFEDKPYFEIYKLESHMDGEFKMVFTQKWRKL